MSKRKRFDFFKMLLELWATNLRTKIALMCPLKAFFQFAHTLFGTIARQNYLTALYGFHT